MKTKLLVAEIRANDGTECTVRTYADERFGARLALRDILSRGDKIIRREWIDTLTERRKEWNRAHPECPIPLDL